MDAHAALADLTTLDRQALHALVIAQQEKLLNRDSEIEHLKLVIAKLRRMMFGTKSEKVTREIEQLELKLEDLETRQAERAEAAANTIAKNKPTRRPLPEHLPREVHTHLPDEKACPECGGELRSLGEDVSEMLEYIPASFKVIRHVRPKLSCTRCDAIVEADAPSRPIERGLAGPGLLAHVLVAKYADHLPLYRQSEIYAREGVELDRSTLADWVGATSELLSPLVDAVRKHVLAATKLHADDTPFPVLAPGMGRTKTARLWTYVRDDRPAGNEASPAVWFAYTEDRKGEHPRQHLSSFSGILQADAYAGFHHLYERGKIAEAACWAHTRRKFHDIHVANGSAIAAQAIVHIGALYDIEREIRGKPAVLRCEVRQARARPLIDDLQNWFNKTLAGLSRKSDTAAAIRYALSRWRALTRYLDDGSIEIDNSLQNGHCASWLSVAKTISSLDPTRVVNGPRPATVCSAQPSSMDSIRSFIYAMFLIASPITPSTAYKNSSPGTWPTLFQAISLECQRAWQSGTSSAPRHVREIRTWSKCRISEGLS